MNDKKTVKKKKVKVFPAPNMANKTRVLKTVENVGEKFPALKNWCEELAVFVEKRC